MYKYLDKVMYQSMTLGIAAELDSYGKNFEGSSESEIGDSDSNNKA